MTGLVVDLGELWEPVTLRDRLARALGDPSLELGYWLGDRYDGRGWAAVRHPAARRRARDDAGRGRRRARRGAGSRPDRARRPGAGRGGRGGDAAGSERTSACRQRCSPASSSSLPRGGGSSRPRTRSAAGCSASSARAPSGGCPGCPAHVDGARPGESTGARAPSSWRDVERQLEAARAELRELARGIHPRRSRRAGWAPHCPSSPRARACRSSCSVDGGASPAPVEAAAYFVCAEALTNIAKYASASRVQRSSVKREPGAPQASPSPTTAPAAPTRSAAPGCAGSPTASRRSAAAQRGQPTRGGDPARRRAPRPVRPAVRARRRHAAGAW